MTNGDSIRSTRVQAFSKVFQSGLEGWGLVLVNIVFGTWSGRVLLETGIAATLTRKTTELGGDKPAITCILLYTAAAAILSSLFGTSAVVVISVTVLPIFMSLGVPKALSVVSFMLSIGTGMFLNPAPLGQYAALFLDEGDRVLYPYEQYVEWGDIVLAIQLASIIIPILSCMRKRSIHSWATRGLVWRKLDFTPMSSLLAPFIPVFLLIAFKILIIVGLLIGNFYALFVCGKLKSFQTACRTFSKDFSDGMVDTAPLVGFLLMILILNKAVELCTPYFNALLGNIIPRSTLSTTIISCMLTPLGMFRGPFTLYGCGAATLSTLKGVGFEATFLVPLMIAVTTAMNVPYYITQSQIVWGVSYTKVSTKEFLRMGVVCGWIICYILQVITLIMLG